MRYRSEHISPQAATHTAGGQIDHVYFRDLTDAFETPDLLRVSPYYSDHDALCTTLKPSQVENILI